VGAPVLDRYRFLTFDVLTQAFVGELELSDVVYNLALGADGTATGKLQLPSMSAGLASTEWLTLETGTEGGAPLAVSVAGELVADAVAAQTRRDLVNELMGLIIPLRRQLVIERDGQPIWAGLIFAAPGTDNLALTATEFMAYLRRRLYPVAAVWDGLDMFTIVRTLLTYAAAQYHGNVGITVATTGTLGTAVVEQTVNPWDELKIGQAIEDMASAEDGFEYAIRPGYTPTGNLTKTWTMARRMGRRYTETGFVFEVGQNVAADGFTWPDDGLTVANKLYGSGTGSGQDQLRTTRQNTTMLDQGYPLLEDTYSLRDETDVARLGARTAGRLAAVARPPIMSELTVEADGDPGLGDYLPGDGFLFRCPPDLVPRFPDGIEVDARIVNINVDTSGGTETVKITMVEDA
jgi:hypothetical protein